MIEITAKIHPRLQVKVTADNQKRAIMEIGFFTDLPPKCPRCDGLYAFGHRESDGFHFFEARCDNGHITQFGQHKKGNTLFYKASDGWKTIEERKSNSSGQAQQNSQPDNLPSDMQETIEDDLPF